MKMLEIGFLFGESYEMWVSYFPRGKVYFMDKDFSEDYWKSKNYYNEKFWTTVR